MKRTLLNLFSLAVVLAMVIPSGAVAAPTSQKQLQPPPPDAAQLKAQSDRISPELALDKIDPALRDAAQKGGKNLVDIYVSVRTGANLSKYLSNPLVRPAVMGVQYVYGQTLADNLLSIAQEPSVVAIVSNQLVDRTPPMDEDTQGAPSLAEQKARIEALKANALTYAEAQAKAGGEVKAEDWFDVQDGHKSAEAWKKGFQGQGVIVGVIDDGIDFAHPDLQGTTARVTDPTSPYYGWPMAFSQASTQYFAYDVIYGTNYIASGATASRWADTRTTIEAHPSFEGGSATVMFKPLGSNITHTYTIPTTSLSNRYKLGSLPERNLLAVYGERPAVLVVDEHAAGVYDTVYVDLDNNYDFTDEKPATQASPEVYRDMNGDGFADISGGQIVWISDGRNPPPVTDWMWGVTCADSSATMKGCPNAGNLVLFSGPFEAGYTHGTQCASNIAAQGKVSGGLSAQPFRIGGMVQGAAPKVGLMDLGDFYYSYNSDDHYIVAALGYDGIPNSGDEVQITTNSYGSFTQMWGGFGYEGRLITALNLSVAPNTAYVFSAGNEGPGYGPQEGDSSPTTIQAGSSTQYGSTNWDSIASADQIVYGDITSFFSHGPNNDGSSGLDVLGNGGRGAGDEGLNYYGFDGATSWGTWGGTSRSGPVVGGNLALIYQAYKARNGVWPTWDVAKALLKSGATNSASSPFFQGAGVVNADRSTDLAAGLYGVYATPDEWDIGDWQGTQYLNFPKVAHPGDIFTQTYTVYNPSGYNINVSLSDGAMTLITKTQMTFTTSDESLESSFNFHSPDYLMKLDPALIPADAEVMIVRYVHPYSSFDPTYSYTPNPASSWRFLLYNWTDLNGDGKLWVDTDGNGVVNHTGDGQFDNDGFERLDFSQSEIEEGEYIRMDYEFGGLAIPVIVHDPLKRMASGYYFGFQHRYNDHTVKTTTFQIGVEFYKRADIPWLNLSKSSLLVPANSTATFNAVAAIPAFTPSGSYEGVIFMKDPGDANHTAFETALPVVANVIAELPNGGSVTLGNTPMLPTMFQNSWTNGYFNWYGGGWTGAGDWRKFFLNIDSTDLQAQNLLIHTSWTYTPTDFNTWVLGPTDDCASNGTGTCAWFEPGVGQPDPTVFGPYTLQPIASNEPFLAGAAYPFHTSTGGPDDWLKVPLDRTGLYEVALHNTLYAGKGLAEQFKVDVGTLRLNPVMDPAVGSATLSSVDVDAYTNTGQVDLQFTPSIGIPGFNAALSGSTSTARTNMVTTVPQSDPKGDLADNVYVPIDVTVPGTTKLLVYLPMPANIDVDLYVYYDTNGNGSWDSGDALVGSSGRSAGNDDYVTLNNPATGRYFAGLNGYDLGGAASLNFAWYYELTVPSGLPTDPVIVFSNTVPIMQDSKFDPTTSSFSMTVTTTERSAALNATVTGIPSGSDVDLYVTDNTGAIVAESQTTGNANEAIKLTPAVGEYRFAEGTAYTVWAHGFSVPTPPISPTVKIWWDELNLWLSSEDPDVSVKAINPGETVTVTLNFEKENWNVGDAPLTARLTAGPSAIPTAFDEVVTLNRTNAPQPPTAWASDNLNVKYTVDAPRGPYPFALWTLGGEPVQTMLGRNGEMATWTMVVRNDDPTFATPTFNLWAEVDNFFQKNYVDPSNPYLVPTFDGFVISPTVGTFGYDPANSIVGSPVVTWTGSLAVGESFTMTWKSTMPANMIPSAATTVDLLSLVYDPIDWWIGGGTWSGSTASDVYARNFSTSSSTGAPFFSSKTASPDMVMPGDQVVFTIELVNPSAVDRDVYVSDMLPSGLTLVSSSGPGANPPSGNTATWALTLPGSTLESRTLVVTATVASTAAAGTTLVNTANIYNKLDSGLLWSESASVSVEPTAELTLDKTADKLIGRVGNQIKYTLVFGNKGPLTAMDVVMKDPVPSDVVVDTASITATAPTVKWKAADNTVAWTGDLAAGQIVTVTYQATIASTATDYMALINLASITAPNAMSEIYGSAATEVLPFSKVYLPLVLR